MCESGKKILLECGGQDITSKFNKYHPWINAGMILRGNLKGRITGPIPSICTISETTPNSPIESIPLTILDGFRNDRQSLLPSKNDSEAKQSPVPAEESGIAGLFQRFSSPFVNSQLSQHSSHESKTI